MPANPVQRPKAGAENAFFDDQLTQGVLPGFPAPSTRIYRGGTSSQGDHAD